MPLSKYISGEFLFAFLLLTLPVFTQAAIAPLSPEEKQKRSTHIVTGEVVEITSSAKKSEVEKAVGFHRDRIFRITLLVQSVAKGEAVAKGDRILILAWKPATRIPALPGPQGHEGIPEKGDQVTLFLKKVEDQEAFKPLLPNGIEKEK